MPLAPRLARKRSGRLVAGKERIEVAHRHAVAGDTASRPQAAGGPVRRRPCPRTARRCRVQLRVDCRRARELFAPPARRRARRSSDAGTLPAALRRARAAQRRGIGVDHRRAARCGRLVPAAGAVHHDLPAVGVALQVVQHAASRSAWRRSAARRRARAARQRPRRAGRRRSASMTSGAGRAARSARPRADRPAPGSRAPAASARHGRAQRRVVLRAADDQAARSTGVEPRRSDAPAASRSRRRATVRRARPRRTSCRPGALRQRPRRGVDRRYQRLAEGAVEVDRPGRRRPRVRRPRAPPCADVAQHARGRLGQRQIDEPLGVVAVETDLVDGLRRADVAQLVRPVGGQHDQRHARVAAPRRRPGRKLAAAVPDVQSSATGSRRALRHAEREEARPSARRGASRARMSGWRATSSSASGVEREPGQTHDVPHARAGQLVDQRADVTVERLPAWRHAPRPASAASIGAQLQPRLRVLALRVRAGDDAAAGEQRRGRAAAAAPSECATANSPSPAASIQPTGPAYQPRSSASCARMALERGLARIAADGRRRVQPRNQIEQARPAAQAAVDRREQVLDVAQRRTWRRLASRGI